jgi:hypothetical protein
MAKIKTPVCTVDGALVTTPEDAIEEAAISAPSSEQPPSTADDCEKFCVYLGPTVVGKIQNGTIYPGAKAKVLETLGDVIKKYPLTAGLIVTDKTLVQDRVKIKTPGNALYVKYQQFASGLKKQGGK